ncbi:hypothetical protein FAI40_03720 [Acetobacteraceae bacterium]|nr:hypothetical protein FAI40_03720 [Acetobacteraceae bacterium]
MREENIAPDAPIPSAQHLFNLHAPRWIKAGQSIEIEGTIITDGMFYLGEIPRNSTTSLKDFGPELINLALDIAPLGQFTMRQTGNNPSYQDLAPSGRRAYLHWLSQGRRHTDADPGFAMIFFYGLERRVLTTPRPLDAESIAEWSLIAQELKGLAAVYGHRSLSLKGGISRLLEWMRDYRLATDPEIAEKYLRKFLVPEDLPEEERPQKWMEIWENIQKIYPHPRAKRTEIPWRLRLALGLMSQNALPLSPPMALAWLHYHPESTLRTPAARCPKEFDQLFMTCFAEEFPQWMRLIKSRFPLKKTYSPTSYGMQFYPKLFEEFHEIPDIAPLKNALNKLEEIALNVCDQLDLYSRALSKEPENAEGIDLLILLPFPLWPSLMQEKIKNLAERIAQEGTDCASFKDFFEQINPNPQTNASLPKRLSLRQINVLLENLKTLEIGVEPTPNKNAVDLSEKYGFFHYSFKANETQETLPTEIRFLLALGTGLATSDNHGLNAQRKRFLHDQLLNPNLLPETPSPLQAQQAKAHLLYLHTLSAAKIFNLIKKKLPSLNLTPVQKVAYLNMLIKQAKLLGMVSIGAMKFLEKLYKLFDHDPASLPSDVSRGHIDLPGTFKNETSEEKGLNLDHGKIAEKREATKKITGILDTIFNPEEETTSPPEPLSPQTSACPKSENNKTVPETPTEETKDSSFPLAELDSAHQKMAQKLLEKSEWERAEIEQIAENLDLMAEGALETINDAAFDVYDEPFIEGEDPFEINPEMLEILAEFIPH